MNKLITGATALALMMTSCNKNPLLEESGLPYGAPAFDKIKTEHYMPAFEQGIAEQKAEIDAIVANEEAPTFENTIEALEFSGRTLSKVESIFFNLMEADTNDDMQKIAEEVSPKLTELSLYISLNAKLFEKVKSVYEMRDSLNLEKDQMKLLEDTYKSFARSGANLSEEDKETYGKLCEELSLLALKYGKNALDATNAWTLDLNDEADLAGLPQFVIDLGRQTAEDKGKEGWVFDLSYPSYSAFIKYSERRDLREKIFTAYGSKAFGGEFDNCQTIKDIVDHRIKIANILGYPTWADYQLEERMVKTPAEVNTFLDKLLVPTLPVAKKEIADILAYAKANGFEGEVLEGWDFSFWSEKYKQANYALSDEELKPYFQLENCIDAVLGLATKLYGLQFEERKDIPGYHKDVKVFDVKDSDGTHLALFYADFFPRESKRGGAWMTEFRGQSIRNGVEYRPFISIVTNFTKPTADAPSLLTHYELTTFLHEFGHSLHGMMAKGRYESLTGTNVARDFVELPSQIMENWGYEPEFLQGFAKHYQTGETIPEALVEKIVAAKNYLAAYGQIRQLNFGVTDMAWHTLTSVPEKSVVEFEKDAVASMELFPVNSNTCFCTSFSHIFNGGYSAGYYSYKWAEVLEADAFSLFEQKGIFNTEVSGAFRREILEKGSSEDEAVIYRNFRGHNPEPDALLRKLGIIK